MQGLQSVEKQATLVFGPLPPGSGHGHGPYVTKVGYARSSERGEASHFGLWTITTISVVTLF